MVWLNGGEAISRSRLAVIVPRSAVLPSALLLACFVRPVLYEIRPVRLCYLARGLEGTGLKRSSLDWAVNGKDLGKASPFEGLTSVHCFGFMRWR